MYYYNRKLPTVQLQWGTGTHTNPKGVQTVSFPLAYPLAPFTVLVTMDGQASTGNMANPYDKTKFSIYSSYAATCNIYWASFGH